MNPMSISLASERRESITLPPWLLALIVIAAMGVGYLLAAPALESSPPASTIGGTEVPTDLDCEEDEVIGFHGVPDSLDCLHLDNL